MVPYGMTLGDAAVHCSCHSSQAVLSPALSYVEPDLPRNTQPSLPLVLLAG